MKTVNMAMALENERYAERVFYDKYYTPASHRQFSVEQSQMDEITAYWEDKGRVAIWRERASKDNTEYLIEDDEYADAKEKGKNDTKNKIGYDGHKNYKSIHNTQQAAADVAYQTVGKEALNNAGEKLVTKEGTKLGKMFEKSAEKATEKATNKAMSKGALDEGAKNAGEQAGAKASKNLGCLIGCALAAAEGAEYIARRPNKEQVESLRVLRDEEIPNGVNAVNNAKSDMIRTEEEISENAVLAAETNEEANSDLEQIETEKEFYLGTYLSLKEKNDNGETLTKTEKAMMKELSVILGSDGELAAQKEEIKQSASDTVSDLHVNIEDRLATYGESATTLAEKSGVAALGASYDVNTQNMALTEGIVQTVNVASGTLSVAKAISVGSATSWAGGAGLVYLAAAAAGAFGVATSTAAVTEQTKFYAETGDEIAAREGLEGVIDDADEFYRTSVDISAGNLDATTELELNVPKDDGITIAPSNDSETETPNPKTPAETLKAREKRTKK